MQITTRTTTQLRQLLRDFGHSISFDGSTNAFVSIGTMGNFGSNLGSGLTFGCFFKHTGGQNAIPRLFGTLNTGTTTGVLAHLNFDGSTQNANRIHVLLRDNAGNAVSGYAGADSVGNINDGRYHTFYVTINPTAKTITMYLDARLLSTNYISQATLGSFANFSFPMYIGCSNSRGTSANPFTGQLDEVVFYSGTTVTASDVNLIFHQGRYPSLPFSYHKFDEGTGTTTADSSGSNTGTLGSGATWSNDIFMKQRITASTRLAV